MVSYQVTDALEEDAGSRFRRGDEVRFKVSGVTDKTTYNPAVYEIELRSSLVDSNPMFYGIN